AYTGTRDLYVGGHFGTERFFHGAIDDVRVFNRELSAAEIRHFANDKWAKARTVRLTGADTANQTATGRQFIPAPGGERWFKVAGLPDSRFLINLTGPGNSPLPANYDLSLYTDVGVAYGQFLQPAPPTKLSAEFAPLEYSPLEYSPLEYSPLE